MQLPKTISSGVVQDRISGIESGDINNIILSYATLSVILKSLKPVSSGTLPLRLQPSTFKLHKIIDRTSEQEAPAAICNNSQTRYSMNDRVIPSSQLLTILTER